jgi:predicted aldo/keto reductase-like oxidoreductase
MDKIRQKGKEMIKSKSKTRRDFLKTGVSGLAGAVMAPSLLKSAPQEKEKKFIFRTLGRTGINVPIISMGTYNAPDLVKSALDAGITHIDTSAEYREGNDERMFGEVLKDRPRDSYVVGTSIGMWHLRTADQVRSTITPKVLKEKFEGSFERLNLDAIDIYYLGGVQHKEIIDHKPYLELMKEFKKSGKTKFLGITTHANEPEIIRAATDTGIYDVILTSYNFRKNNIKDIQKAVKYAAGKGMGIVAMKTQAGVYWDRKAQKELINQKAALKWVLQDENVHTAIPGFTSFDHITEALSIMENLRLSEKELADLKLGGRKSATGLFCSQCEECLPQCPHSLDIPVLMRSYMYAYGYHSPAKARETLNRAGISGVPCSRCSSCSVQCPSGFDVKTKAADIARILSVPGEFLV